jgi:hypothetical protein
MLLHCFLKSIQVHDLPKKKKKSCYMITKIKLYFFRNSHKSDFIFFEVVGEMPTINFVLIKRKKSLQHSKIKYKIQYNPNGYVPIVTIIPKSI